jgi:hypothetical protein
LGGGRRGLLFGRQRADGMDRSPAPAAKAAIAIAARYSTLMVMVPPSAPRTNRTLSEMVPERCLTLALERLLARRPGLHPRQSGRARRNGPRSIPSRKFPNASARRSNCFPLASERRHDQKAGNESSGQDFRSTRPSLTVNCTAHVADSQRFLTTGPAVLKNKRRADSQKRRSPVPFQNCQPCSGCAPMLALSYPNEASHAQPH